MNPMTNMKNVIKLSEQELNTSNKTSWHDQYRDSAWIFVGGLPYDLSEGDLICVFSQYGEIVTINLVRDKDTGKQKGFCFVCYEDQRSTDLAVDNFNGIKILGRTIRVDHVSNYKVPKESRQKAADIKKQDEENFEEPPAAAAVATVSNPALKVKEEHSKSSQRVGDIPYTDEIKLPLRLPIHPIKEEDAAIKKEKKTKKKEKKEKKKKSKKKKHKRDSSSDDSSQDGSSDDHRRKKKRSS